MALAYGLIWTAVACVIAPPALGMVTPSAVWCSSTLTEIYFPFFHADV